MKIMDLDTGVINWHVRLISAGVLKYLDFKEFFENSLSPEQETMDIYESQHKQNLGNS